MEITASSVIFYLLSAVIVIFSILTVVTRRILRAATYLLFVLFATAGLYFLLGYHFLGAVQIAIYAGGIIVLYVFSILLTSHAGDKSAPISYSKMWAGIVAALAGTLLCSFVVVKHHFLYPAEQALPVDMKQVGEALMGMEKYQYLLPFEAISVLLLACIIGGIMIARKR